MVNSKCRFIVVFVAAGGCVGDTPTMSTSSPSAAELTTATARDIWNPVDLGTDPTGLATAAYGVSRHSHIAGFSTFLNQGSQTFVQRAGAARRYLSTLPGHVSSSPTAINDAGLISGRSHEAPVSLPTPVFWDGEGRASAIPGIPNGEAFDVSETGWIVGYDISFNGVRAFRWRRGNAPVFLQGDSFTQGQALAVNDLGTTVGIVVGNAISPAVWDLQGVLQRIPLPVGARQGRATDINNLGDVVGDIDMGSGLRRAFKWSKSQGLTLLPNPTGTITAFATDIDGRGRVFGYAMPTLRSAPIAYVWINGSPTLLPQLYPGGFVTDVNACGVAVGFATAPDGTSHVIMWLTEC